MEPVDRRSDARSLLVQAGAATLVHWRQSFDTVEHDERIAQFVATANQQNLERLAAEVQRGADQCSR